MVKFLEAPAVVLSSNEAFYLSFFHSPESFFLPLILCIKGLGCDLSEHGCWIFGPLDYSGLLCTYLHNEIIRHNM